MTGYRKGARGERELLNYFHSVGYSVVRSAGSGVNSISPDIVAIKNSRGIALECKAWDSTSISIEHEKWETLMLWKENTGMDTFVAWRMNGKGWFFIKPEEMKRTDKSYTVTRKITFGINRRMEHILELALVPMKPT